ncbi:hypothetical protein F4861DRAFT_540925 [Xylaria intraflava]|nr:hypothetical protein F4861DRAFT_540925 [Xylaria intraflava]
MELASASTSVPYRPGEEETLRYYHGFTGDPKLVARTSTHRWVKPEHVDDYNWSTRTIQVPKRYVAISDSDIIKSWTDEVSDQIIEVLKPWPWNYFFPVGIRLERVSRPVEGTYNPEISNVLLVAVEPDELQWERGLTIAQDCLKILRNARIFGVEVEVCEGTFSPRAACAELEAEVEQLRMYKETNDSIRSMLSGLGYPITSLEGYAPEGSVGLHIRLGGDSSPVYALTCRHVVHDCHAAQDAYRVSGPDNQKRFVVQGSNRTFSQCMSQVKSAQDTFDEGIEKMKDRKDRWESRYQYDEASAHRRPSNEQEMRLQQYEAQATYNKRVLECLEKIKDKSQRIIGHLAFYPRFESSCEQPEYLKDWALIELDSSKFPAAMPDNKVYVADRPGLGFLMIGDNNVMNIELREAERGRTTPITVYKRGNKTGLTSGTVNGIKAVTRRPYADVGFVTRELLILPRPENRKFSDRGDSGASIFDLTGRVVGIVVGSNGNDPKTWQSTEESQSQSHAQMEEDNERSWTDVTFATPIEWVLEDIRRFTGHIPRLP